MGKNKIRTLLTMLGVIIGVAAVIVMISISAGTEATVSEAINGLGSNLMYLVVPCRFGSLGADRSSFWVVWFLMTMRPPSKKRSQRHRRVTVGRIPPLQQLNLTGMRWKRITVVGASARRLPDGPSRDMKVAEGRLLRFDGTGPHLQGSGAG